MSLEYDLVIIGDTAAARAAAIEAVDLQARVAWILPPLSEARSHFQRDLYPYALAQIAATNRTHRPMLSDGLSAPPQLSNYPWQYADAAIDRLEQQASPALLAARGVDTIVGHGEFGRRPHLAFNINHRALRARAYLIATGSVGDYPLIPGIQDSGYLTIDRLPSMVDRQIPLRWAIIGSEAIGVELAQTLAKLGCQVHLIVETAQILPYEDPVLASQIQLQLAADGVRIYLDAIVTQIDRDRESKVAIFGDEAIAIDEIFVALPDRPLVEPFNLSGVGVEYNEKGISIDRYLGTSNALIYACGSVCGNVFGGYHSQHLERYEAKIAVRNALNRRQQKIDYRSYDRLPWAVYTDPPLARVGMTSGAADRDRQDLIILKQDFKTCPKAILDNITSGFCQIIVTRHGKILGAQIIGANAPELIQLLAVAIEQQLTITDIANIPCLSPTYAEIIDRAAQSWQTTRRQRLSRAGWLATTIDRFLGSMVPRWLSWWK
ncbi:NAD(P)/FAD-dependent oxidoreductase [Chamaesiphon sp. VAR_69_metabat_338]|uniref:NAD(P)/FAD-dependent oxidoreductase n=1 Tax=Chamaesiphon sp. VAR_69_metabat_338 TaxID=2964704 RepID=UPI00286E3AF9|nr:NAD(P)/FAD-dependent oxidoreductase [Chamaesiphon sp. VAR_69_metabat_338]